MGGFRVRPAILALLIWLALAGNAYAQQPAKIALLIGNKTYTPAVGPLANPHNDIRVVGEALRAAGFEVLEPVKDATRAQILAAVRTLAEKLNAAGANAVGLLYYSGHGAAIGSQNYLIPVEVAKPDAQSLADGGVLQSEIITRLTENAPQAVFYLVVDACRNNLGGTKGPKGFRPEQRRDGMLIAFAAEPSKPASDDGSDGGPFATAFAAELGKPAQVDLLLFHNVRVAVDTRTRGEQVPWIEDGIRRAERVRLGRQDTAGQTTAADTTRVCGEVAGITSLATLAVMERQHAGTPIADCISARMGEIKAAGTAAARPPEAHAPAEEKPKPSLEEQIVANIKKQEEERAKADAERRRLALLQQEAERKSKAAATPPPAQAPTAPPPNAAVPAKTEIRDTAAKAKLLGKRELASQWISWDDLGTINASELNGLIRLKGEQKSREKGEAKDDFIALEGIVTAIDSKDMTFVGTITQKVYHLNGGQPCTINGQMTFSIVPGKKYWRLQGAEFSGCTKATTYVDIFF